MLSSLKSAPVPVVELGEGVRRLSTFPVFPKIQHELNYFPLSGRVNILTSDLCFLQKKQTCVCLSSSSQFLVSGGLDQSVHIWDLKTKRLHRSLKVSYS